MTHDLSINLIIFQVIIQVNGKTVSGNSCQYYLIYINAQ